MFSAYVIIRSPFYLRLSPKPNGDNGRERTSRDLIPIGALRLSCSYKRSAAGTSPNRPFIFLKLSLPVRMFALAFILGLLALISARPLIHSQIQNAVARMAKDIDDKYLTSAPKMTLVSGLESGRIAAGKPHELHCDIMGTPIVSIYWTFNGKKIQGSEEIHIDEKIQNAGHPIVESGIVGSRLYLNCPTGKNAGIYKCVGFNGYQKIESTAEIEVEGSSVDCKANRKTAPQIVQWTESRFEMSGNAATLICRANKAADWAWTFDGELIKENDRFEISPRGDLVIKNIEWNDMGSYHCIARNRYGEARQETFLYPTAKRSN